MKDNHVTAAEVVACLKSQAIPFERMDIGANRIILIAQRGGRVFGPFDGEGESLFWINEAFKDPAAVDRGIGSGHWNLGGERFWLNPELAFYCQSPETFDETYTVQKGIDPGEYTLSEERGRVRLEQRAAFKHVGRGLELLCNIRRVYQRARNPLAYAKGFDASALSYFGYTQEISITDLRGDTPIALEPWLVVQVNPGGRVIVPYVGDFDFVDYYTPVGDMQQVFPGYVQLDFSGDRKYKVAYRACATLGRMGYLRRIKDEYSLMIRNYYNDPSEPYCSEPWGDLGNKGCSMYFYNDDLSNGGFGEFENGFAPVGQEAGRTHSESSTSLWFFQGAAAPIRWAIKALLGVDYPLF